MLSGLHEERPVITAEAVGLDHLAIDKDVSVLANCAKYLAAEAAFEAADVAVQTHGDVELLGSTTSSGTSARRVSPCQTESNPVASAYCA